MVPVREYVIRSLLRVAAATTLSVVTPPVAFEDCVTLPWRGVLRAAAAVAVWISACRLPASTELRSPCIPPCIAAPSETGGMVVEPPPPQPDKTTAQAAAHDFILKFMVSFPPGKWNRS